MKRISIDGPKFLISYSGTGVISLGAMSAGAFSNTGWLFAGGFIAFCALLLIAGVMIVAQALGMMEIRR